MDRDGTPFRMVFPRAMPGMERGRPVWDEPGAEGGIRGAHPAGAERTGCGCGFLTVGCRLLPSGAESGHTPDGRRTRWPWRRQCPEAFGDLGNRRDVSVNPALPGSQAGLDSWKPASCRNASRFVRCAKGQAVSRACQIRRASCIDGKAMVEGSTSRGSSQAHSATSSAAIRPPVLAVRAVKKKSSTG